jgi:hypothetical protein
MPDRADSTQEGIDLPPISATRMIARDEAHQVILEHIRLCPFAVDNVNNRLRNVELNLSRLIGFMLGSGLLGGVAGSIVAKLMQ